MSGAVTARGILWMVVFLLLWPQVFWTRVNDSARGRESCEEGCCVRNSQSIQGTGADAKAEVYLLPAGWDPPTRTQPFSRAQAKGLSFA